MTQKDPEAAICLLSSPWSQDPRLRPLRKFPSVNGLLGIAEVGTDAFVVGFNFSGSGGQVNGTAETWLVDFRDEDSDPSPSIKRITRHPDMVFPNGLAALPRASDAVLIGD